MADSTVSDIIKMKVIDLRKELKARGLAHTGDKAELVARLQAAMTPDDNDHGDITLDSDEIDSEGVLEDEDDGLDESAVELALADQPPAPKQPESEPKPAKPLKRKLSDKPADNKDSGTKKIVLNRATSITTTPTETTPSEPTKKPIEAPASNAEVTNKEDPKLKLELRAKRFGLPVKISDQERKEARKMRFGQGAAATATANTPASLAENVEKLKKRAERFGTNVSKVMTAIEEKERLEKRKAKFGLVK